MLNIGRTIAYRLIAEGEIRSIVVGRKLRRVPTTAITEYIEQRLTAGD